MTKKRWRATLLMLLLVPHTSKSGQLGITDVKGPTNFVCYWRIFVIANIGNKEKLFEGTTV